MNGKKEIAQRLTVGLYGNLRTQLRKELRQIAKTYIDTYESVNGVSETNIKIAHNIIQHIDENIAEGAIALVDYISKQEFQTTVPRSFSNPTASVGIEVTYLPEKIQAEIEAFDFEQCARHLEADKINSLKQMTAQGPNKVDVKALKAQLHQLELKLAGLEGELKGKESHINDLKEVKVEVKKSNQAQEERALVLQSEAQDTKRILALIAERLGMMEGEQSQNSRVAEDALYSDRGLLNDSEVRIVVKEKLVSNPRLQLIRTLSEKHSNESSDVVRDAIESAVCQLISDEDRSMIGIIQVAEAKAKLELNVPDLQDSIGEKSKVIKYVENLIREHYKNTELADAIKGFVANGYQPRVEVAVSPNK